MHDSVRFNDKINIQMSAKMNIFNITIFLDFFFLQNELIRMKCQVFNYSWGYYILPRQMNKSEKNTLISAFFIIKCCTDEIESKGHQALQ